MSNTRHPRKKARLYSSHRRKNKEWGKDSHWKPKERITVYIIEERRSPRTRLKK